MVRYRPYRLDPFRRRLRYTGARLLYALAAAAVLAALAFMDRSGFFGHSPTPDRLKYDGNSFVVVNVIDGDTLDIDCPDGLYQHTRIRLWGMDTPETVKPDTPPQHFGHEASEFTKQQALHQRVLLELEPMRTRDKYNRLLVYVYLPDGKMLNRLLVEKGYAYADPRYENRCKAEFARLEKHARKASLGLWKDVKPDDLPYYHPLKPTQPGSAPYPQPAK